MSRQMGPGLLRPLEVLSVALVSLMRSQLTLFFADGFVRIWSTEAIYNAADPNYSKPKQLAYMNYHSGTIHSVRFAGNGKYLASGADDKIVCVYQLEPGPPSHSGGFGAPLRSARSVLNVLITSRKQ
jgi:protein HIRA/HIR1